MNTPDEQNTTTGPARTNDQTQPRKDAPPSFGSDSEPRDSRETAPDIGKKSDLGKTYQPGSGKDEAKPLQAAKGDDDLMSKKPGKPT